MLAYFFKGDKKICILNLELYTCVENKPFEILSCRNVVFLGAHKVSVVCGGIFGREFVVEYEMRILNPRIELEYELHMGGNFCDLFSVMSSMVHMHKRRVGVNP